MKRQSRLKKISDSTPRLVSPEPFDTEEEGEKEDHTYYPILSKAPRGREKQQQRRRNKSHEKPYTLRRVSSSSSIKSKKKHSYDSFEDDDSFWMDDNDIETDEFTVIYKSKHILHNQSSTETKTQQGNSNQRDKKHYHYYSNKNCTKPLVEFDMIKEEEEEEAGKDLQHRDIPDSRSKDYSFSDLVLERSNTNSNQLTSHHHKYVTFDNNPFPSSSSADLSHEIAKASNDYSFSDLVFERTCIQHSTDKRASETKEQTTKVNAQRKEYHNQYIPDGKNSSKSSRVFRDITNTVIENKESLKGNPHNTQSSQKRNNHDSNKTKAIAISNDEESLCSTIRNHLYVSSSNPSHQRKPKEGISTKTNGTHNTLNNSVKIYNNKNNMIIKEENVKSKQRVTDKHDFVRRVAGDSWLSHFSSWPFSTECNNNNNNNDNTKGKEKTNQQTVHSSATFASNEKENVTSILSSPVIPCDLLTHFWGEQDNETALKSLSAFILESTSPSPTSNTITEKQQISLSNMRQMCGLSFDKEEETEAQQDGLKIQFNSDDFDHVYYANNNGKDNETLLYDYDPDDNSVIDYDAYSDDSVQQERTKKNEIYSGGEVEKTAIEVKLKLELDTEKTTDSMKSANVNGRHTKKKTMIDPIYSSVSYDSAQSFTRKLCSTGIPLRFYNYPGIIDDISNDNDHDGIDYANWESVPVVLYLFLPSREENIEEEDIEDTELTSPKLMWIARSKTTNKTDTIKQSKPFISEYVDTNDIYYILTPQDVDHDHKSTLNNFSFLHISLNKNNNTCGMDQKCFSITTKKGQVYVFDTSFIPLHLINPTRGNLKDMFDQDCMDELSRDYIVNHLKFVLNRLDLINSVP